MVALPLLIHLINRLRYRRVRWAAMDFLLASHRRNRRRVWLKEILLIAARMAALLLVLLTVAQIGCRQNRWASWFGGSVTHHYVVVDDSYSMGEQIRGQTPMSRAHEVLRNLARQIASRDNQRLTLIRYSQAQLQDQPASGRGPDEPGSAESADPLPTQQSESAPGGLVNGLAVDREISSQIESMIVRMEPTSLAVGPRAALEWVAHLIGQREEETPVVYLLSDFRSKDWDNNGSGRPALQALEQSSATIELVRCCDEAASNLAITELRTDGAIRVAGVPLMMTLDVKNLGVDPVRNLQVRVSTAAFPESQVAAAAPELITREANELPILLVENIDPGETVTRRFPVFFAQPGQHEVVVELPTDSITADNRAWAVVRVTPSARVLVVDDPPLDDSPVVSLALNPGGMTGIQTTPATRAGLRDATIEELNQYESVFLLDIDRLDEATVRRLRQYVNDGGGLVFFTGPNTGLAEFRQTLYDEGQGIFPLPLDRIVDIPPPTDSDPADIVPGRHPVFAHVVDVRNSPLDLVQVRRMCQPPADWSADADGVRILATLRGQTQLPLMVEKPTGRGHVLAVLTTAGPAWNNWCRNGTWPASLLLMQDYVSRGRVNDPTQRAGQPIRIGQDPGDFQPDYQIVTPGNEPGERLVWQKTLAVNAGNDARISASESTQPGVYEIWRRDLTGATQLDRWAVNVDVTESEPRLIDRAQMTALTQHPRLGATTWQDFQPALQRNRSGSLVRILLAGLVLVLTAEQILALLNSYHS